MTWRDLQNKIKQIPSNLLDEKVLIADKDELNIAYIQNVDTMLDQDQEIERVYLVYGYE